MKCGFEPCDRQASVAGLCRSHWSQQHRGKRLTPLRTYGMHQVIDGMKRCITCDETKSTDDFYRRANGNVEAECRKCAVARVQKRAGRIPSGAEPRRYRKRDDT